MGINAHKMDGPSLAAHQPPLDQYELVSSGPNYYLWHNAVLRNSLIEFTFNINSEELLRDHIQSYFWRHRHYLFVSTLYFRQQLNSDKYSIFYERIFTNLSRIKDLCFQDTLQFYYTGLKAFQLLYERFGYFEVLQQMFHVTLDSKVKIWCDRNISRIYPPTTRQGSEQAMVRRIINVIDSNSDLSHVPIHVGSILNKYEPRTFDQAIEKLRSLCKQNNLFIGDKLKCLQTIYRGGVEKLVDQFRSPQEQSGGITTSESSQTKDVSKVQYKHSIGSAPMLPNILNVSPPLPFRAFTSDTLSPIYHRTVCVPQNRQHLLINSNSINQNKIPTNNISSNLAGQTNQRMLYTPKINHPQLIRISTSRSSSSFPLQRRVHTPQKHTITVQPSIVKFNQQQIPMRSKSIEASTSSIKNLNSINKYTNSFRYFPKPPIQTNSRISTQDGNKSLFKEQTKKVVFHYQPSPVHNQQKYSPIKLSNQNEYTIINKDQIQTKNEMKKSPIQALENKTQSRVQEKMDTSLQLITINLNKQIQEDDKRFEKPIVKINNIQTLNELDPIYHKEYNKILFSQERLNEIIFSFKSQKSNTQNIRRVIQEKQEKFQNVFEKSQKTTTINESSKYLSQHFTSQSKNFLTPQSLSLIQDKNGRNEIHQSISSKKYMPHIDQDIWNDLLKIRPSKIHKTK